MDVLAVRVPGEGEGGVGRSLRGVWETVFVFSRLTAQVQAQRETGASAQRHLTDEEANFHKNLNHSADH